QSAEARLLLAIIRLPGIAGKTPAEHLLEHGEVVGPLDRLDPKVAVVCRLWPPLLEDHHRAHWMLTLDVRDVVTLDPDGKGRQVQLPLQVVQERPGALL